MWMDLSLLYRYDEMSVAVEVAVYNEVRLDCFPR
jgi:hypothetical protein